MQFKSPSWIPLGRDQETSHFDSLIEIQPKEPFRCATDWSLGDDSPVRHIKVCVPLIYSRIEEWNELFSQWIERRNIRTFESVAIEACQCKIPRSRCAAVLFGDDVIRLVTEVRFTFCEEAILATVPRPRADPPP